MVDLSIAMLVHQRVNLGENGGLKAPTTWVTNSSVMHPSATIKMSVEMVPTQVTVPVKNRQK